MTHNGTLRPDGRVLRDMFSRLEIGAQCGGAHSVSHFRCGDSGVGCNPEAPGSQQKRRD
jgi:hypothetical protein